MERSPFTPAPIPAEPFARVSSMPPPPPVPRAELSAIPEPARAESQEQAPTERRIGSDSSIRPHVLSAGPEDQADDASPARITSDVRKARMRVIVGGVVGSAALLMMLAIGMRFVGSSASTATSAASLPAAAVEAPPVAEIPLAPAPPVADPAPTASASAATIPAAAPIAARAPTTFPRAPNAAHGRAGSQLIRKAPF